MMRTLPSVLFSAAFGLLFLSGCSGVNVSSTVDRSFNFSSAKTYAIVETDPKSDPQYFGQMPVNMDTARDIQLEINHQLSEKGYEVVSPTDADMLVQWGGKVMEQAGVGGSRKEDRPQDAFVGNQDYGDPDFEPPSLADPMVDFRRATLSVSVLNPENRESVWVGEATGVVDEFTATETEIRRFVTALMQRFPN